MSFSRAVVVIAAAILLGVSPATEQALAQTAPATNPATETPKEGLLIYNAAMAAQNMEAMLARTSATTEEMQRVAKAMARADMYVAGLLKAARDKFGEDASAKLGRAIGDASDATIRAAVETIDGDHATLRFDQGGTSMVRVNGVWKLDVDAALKQSQATPTALMESFSRHGNRAKVVAQEVAAGQFKSIDEVIDRMSKAEEATTQD